MATFFEQTEVSKIAKALIINRGKLWVLICGDNKVSIGHCILKKIRDLGIESESQLYRDIDYSICDLESIKDRPIIWSHNVLICNIDGLINEITGAVCAKTIVNTIGS
jgi:hypothetical protein